MPYKDPEKKRAYQKEYLRTGPKGSIRVPRTQCPSGHDMTPENTYLNPKGFKVCRVCQRAALRAHIARKKKEKTYNVRIEPRKW